jgi:hypothetical protein
MSKLLPVLFFSVLALYSGENNVHYQLQKCEPYVVVYHFSSPVNVAGPRLITKLRTVAGVKKVAAKGSYISIRLMEPPANVENPSPFLIQTVETIMTEQFRIMDLTLTDNTGMRRCSAKFPASFYKAP